MNLGYVSNGGSSSSSSNLSPLAPPFTVGRSNSKHNSILPSLLTEPPPYAVKNWSYPHSSSSNSDFAVDSVRTSSVPAGSNYADNPQTTSWSPSNPSLKASSDWYGLNGEDINSRTTHWSPKNPGVKSGSEWSSSKPNPSGALNPEYDQQPKHWSHWSRMNPDIKSGSKGTGINPNPGGSLNPECNPQPTHWSPTSPGNKSGSKLYGSNPNPSGASATNSFSYPVDYTSYVGSEDVALVDLNEPSYDFLSTSGLDSCVDGSSQVDYTQNLSGLEHGPQWEAIWDGGLSEAKRGKRMEADNSFSSLEAAIVYSRPPTSFMKPGALAARSLKKGQKDSTLSSEMNQGVNGFTNYTDFIGRENQTGQSVAGKLDSKSVPVNNHGFIPVDFSNSLSSRVYPTFPEACLQGPTVKPPKEPWANQKPYDISEKKKQMYDAGKMDMSKVTKTSPSVVIKPPAVNTNVSGPGKGSSKTEVSSQISRNDHGSKARDGVQLPDINIPDVESIETVKSEDSPCWKGAKHASFFSPFASVDESAFQLPTKKLPTSDETEKSTPNDGTANSDSDSKISHTGLPSIKSVPISDQEDTTNPTTGATTTVQILVKSMHDLSELLLYHCSNDANALKEKDRLALGQVISNLDTCLSKKVVQVTSKQDSVWPQLGTSNEGACAGKSLATVEAAASSHGRVDFHCAPFEKGDCHLTGKKYENSKGLLSLRDDGDGSKERNMVQEIKKILDENLECEEEIQSQTLVYKNLWLEAEAELCSVSYRARFERMKREIEKFKSTKAKDMSENILASEKISTATLKLTPEVKVGPIPSTSIQDSLVSSNSVETSVMERFNILKLRGEPTAVNGEEEQEKKRLDLSMGPHLGHQNGTGKEGNCLSCMVNSHYETVKEFVADDSAAMQSAGTENSVGSSWYNSSPYSSSEWEHVLKDEFAWRSDGGDPILNSVSSI